MFEDRTFENILSNMLNYVSNRYPNLDTREGSIIYTALAPIALELETAYHEMAMIMDETFLETASKEYLVKHGDEIGVELNEATYAHCKGEFDVDVEIGSRFTLDDLYYTVINKLSDPIEDNPYYVCELTCETPGSKPNGYLGQLVPVTYIQNLSYSQLTSVIIPGEDEEETEAYRYRLQLHAKNPPINGNVAQYEDLMNEYDGVGQYRVIPCWNGLNTVKVTILNSSNRAASPELIAEVQNYLDPNSEGMGNGQAPIGSIVTVDTAVEVPVTIVCQLKLKEGYNSPIGVKEAVENYLESTTLNKTSVGYMPISAEIYNAESVEDVLSLQITVNGRVMDASASPFVSSVTIGQNEIAVLSENSTFQ